MAKQNSSRDRRNIKQQEIVKKHLIDPRYKSAVSTLIFILILIIFFIINNTRREPERGPYPPFYKKSQPDSTKN